ncbi:MAG: acyl-CoA dehydrogenase family protein [Dehalococcoidia bacterium]|nr:acyl-CoA dehydrogenase family protein [Dehalococcoidia bacterium]
MDFELNGVELDVIKTAHDFAESRVRPRARDIDEQDKFPSDLAAEMGRLGLFGLHMPEEYGGTNLGYKAYVLAIEELCSVSMTVGAIMAINALAQECLVRFGTDAQKKRFLPPLVAGESLSTFAFTEGQTGSDPRAITTVAVLDDDDYVLSGEKTFASLAHSASVAIIFAKDDTGKVSAFLVDPKSEGFIIEKEIEMLGVRGEDVCPVMLDHVRVPRENLLGEAGKGYGVLLTAINVGQLGISAEAVGIARGALAMSLSYAKDRMVKDKPMTDLPTTQSLLGEMAARTEAARWLTYRTADLKDHNRLTGKHASMAKLFASQAANDVVDMAMQIHGSYGYTKELEIERLYRDAKVTQIYEVVSEVQRLIIGATLAHES